MRELEQELLKQLDAPGETPEAAAETAIMVYLAAAAEIDRFKEIQKQAKSLMSDIMAETGQDKVRNGAGQAYVGKPSVSVRYNANAIDALCASHDDLAVILWPHRKEIKRAGTLTIRG